MTPVDLMDDIFSKFGTLITDSMPFLELAFGVAFGFLVVGSIIYAFRSWGSARGGIFR